MADKRQLPLTVEEYREAMVPSYHPITNMLLGGSTDKIRVHDFDKDKVITKSSLLDSRSVIPTMFSMEMTEVNHAKFYPVGQEFAAIGMYLGFRMSAMDKSGATNSNNAILRELQIGWDRAALVGEYGNDGLLRSVKSSPYRIVNTASTFTLADDFADKANAMKALGFALKEQVNANTAADSLDLVVYGSALQQLLSDTDTTSQAVAGATSLYDYLRKGFGTKLINVIEVPSLVLKGSVLETANGIAIVSRDALTLDTVGFPDLDDADTDDKENGKFDWYRFAAGSVQFKPEMVGAIINQPITIA